MLLAYIRSIQSDRTAADDVWQETMLVAWRRIDDYDTTRPFGPWLRGIAQKIVLAKFSKPNRITISDAESLEYLSNRFESVHRLNGDTLYEKLDTLRECISKLPEHDRQCIEMRYSQDLKPAELCEQLGVALETIKKRLMRAKQKLIDCMDRKLQSIPIQGTSS